MVTNKKTSKTVKSNKETGKIVKLKPEGKRSTKKQSLKVNKVAKTTTGKTDKSEPSATCPIKEPIARKKDPNKRGNPIKFTSNPPSAATHLKDASKTRNPDKKGKLLNPMKKAAMGAGIESKKTSNCSKKDVKNEINKSQGKEVPPPKKKHCIVKSGTIGATTPPNTSPQANTNTITEEKVS